VIRWEIPAREGLAPLRVHWYDGGKLGMQFDPKEKRGSIQAPNYPPMLAEFEKKFDCDFREGWDGGTFYIGTKGVMHTGCYGQRPRLLPEEAQRAYPVPQARIPRIKGSHFAHFIQSCKDGNPTCADFAYASSITEFLLLGHLAIQAGVGRRVEWDAASMRCTNIPELNQWVKREPRKGWG
jgi:hypothetical protein